MSTEILIPEFCGDYNGEEVERHFIFENFMVPHTMALQLEPYPCHYRVGRTIPPYLWQIGQPAQSGAGPHEIQGQIQAFGVFVRNETRPARVPSEVF
mmetsp:Transcript_28345/g.40106  ORF Transcript_28345/g.40106 Transcript_28345/m.40106 type:complete len:97 (+) Transcript_28345:419-709(+)